jgi:hypothetical protein
MLSEEMCVRLGTALEDASEPVIAPSVDAIATELWKAADACGFEQFREVARTAIAAGGAQEPVAEIFVWFAGNDGAERTGERFIRAWTDDPARVEGLRNAIGLEPTRFAPLPRVAATVPEGFALVPLKPNDAMQAAGAQAVRIDTTVLNRMWTANRVFRAMVEAAASNGGQ